MAIARAIGRAFSAMASPPGAVLILDFPAFVKIPDPPQQGAAAGSYLLARRRVGRDHV